MIKFILNIVLTFVLIAGTTGVSINKHFCGNHLVSSSIGYEDEDCCGNKCENCFDVTKIYQIDDDFITKTFELQSVHHSVYKINFCALIELTKQSLSYFSNKNINAHKPDYCITALNSTDADKLQVFRIWF